MRGRHEPEPGPEPGTGREPEPGRERATALVPSSRLRHADAWRSASQGIGSRAARSALSALGIAVSIAALTAITGLSATNQAHLLADLDAQGANLLVASPAVGSEDAPAFLPWSAPAMTARIPGVELVAVVASAPADVHAYKNDLVPAGQTNGLELRAVAPHYFSAVGASFASGGAFSQAGRGLPETVLGAESARLLGVGDVGQRLWIGGEWYLVTGILNPRPLVGGLDDSVMLGDSWTEQTLWPRHGAAAVDANGPDSGHITSLTITAAANQLDEVREVLARSVDPAHPGAVSISDGSALARSRAIVDQSLSLLVLALAGVALLVGAIGIANTMVVAVIERRGEIGLRRALGARPGHIARQFLLEGMLLAGAGGIAGWMLGGLAVVGVALASGESPVLPLYGVLLYPAIAVGVGVVSGLQPALRAARVPPTVALRAT